jgi:hypothetical protein
MTLKNVNIIELEAFQGTFDTVKYMLAQGQSGSHMVVRKHEMLSTFRLSPN